ncbi:RES family NAD+ phosphorylase [Nitrosospira briensis]|uniref:RES family NAD+ phosphorylase n=1 Tax=Nitrosospira briensis TaxID=35799 RepID=UPI0018D1A43E|nr:RES family NAD+ phosphorylase [Nitrosospira briensis]
MGTCDYCRTEQEILIDPCQLSDMFGVLVNVYQFDDDGKSLVQWLKEDWALFIHPKMDDAHAKELLGDILDDGQIVRRSFIPSKQYEFDRLGQWEELRKELMHENRFFPKAQIDFDRLKLLLERLMLDANEIPSTWYRARVQRGDTVFPIAEMQAPPAKIAPHGRANPAGIPYLYLGSETVTAVSEIRPHTGEIVYVADFTMTNDLKLVDLRTPRRTVSPFLLADEVDVGQMRFDITFLERLGEELIRPVFPHAAAFDYTPSQYLCEFIKKCGYDGVIYRSSVSSGMNLALFKPEKATAGAVQKHVVTRVSVEVEGAQ